MQSQRTFPNRPCSTIFIKRLATAKTYVSKWLSINYFIVRCVFRFCFNSIHFFPLVFSTEFHYAPLFASPLERLDAVMQTQMFVELGHLDNVRQISTHGRLCSLTIIPVRWIPVTRQTSLTCSQSIGLCSHDPTNVFEVFRAAEQQRSTKNLGLAQSHSN